MRIKLIVVLVFLILGTGIGCANLLGEKIQSTGKSLTDGLVSKKEIPIYSESLNIDNSNKLIDFIENNLGQIVKITLDFDTEENLLWGDKSDDGQSIGISSGDSDCIKNIGISQCGGSLIHLFGKEHDFEYSHGIFKLNGYFVISESTDIHFGFVDYSLESIPQKDVLLKAM